MWKLEMSCPVRQHISKAILLCQAPQSTDFSLLSAYRAYVQITVSISCTERIVWQREISEVLALQEWGPYFNPHNPWGGLSAVPCAYNSNTGLHSWASLAGQPSLRNELLASGRPLLKKVEAFQEARLEAVFWPPHVHTGPCSLPHSCTHTKKRRRKAWLRWLIYRRVDRVGWCIDHWMFSLLSF